jgi:hypothetical protein
MTVPKWLAALITIYGAFLLLVAAGTFTASRVVIPDATITAEMLAQTRTMGWIHAALGGLSVVAGAFMFLGRPWAVGLWLAVAALLIAIRLYWMVQSPPGWLDFAIDAVVIGASFVMILPRWRRAGAL